MLKIRSVAASSKLLLSIFHPNCVIARHVPTCSLPCTCLGVQVLCTTSTLAMGVNLPAHLVVLKGTRRWCSDTGGPSGYKEYDRSTCLQMIGRAGRPQFDTEGVAVIMTQKQVPEHACSGAM